MIRKSALILFTIVSLSALPISVQAQDILIQVLVFQGTWTGERPEKIPDEILSASSNSQIAAIRNSVSGTKSDIRAATVEALMKIYDLRTVDDLFSFVVSWNGKDTVVTEAGIFKHSGYRFEFKPKWRFPEILALGTSVFFKEIPSAAETDSNNEKKIQSELKNALHPTRYHQHMDKIMDREIPLQPGDPAIVGIPNKEEGLFLMLMPANRPQPVRQVLPAYPDELIKKGISGQARFRISIDEEGRVRKAVVIKPLHPYLDNSAMQAIKQWVFEPVIKNGKSVRVSFDWAIDFDPEKQPAPGSAPADRAFEPPSPELKKVLELSAAYCQKLSDAAMDFVCEESIKDTDYNLYIPKEMKSVNSVDKTEITSSGMIRVLSTPRLLAPNPFKTKTNRYVCDYQMIKKNDRIEERRIILQENGRSVKEKNLLEEKRFAVLRPLFASVKILGSDRQSLFSFRLLAEDRIQGRDTYVVEAWPRTGAPGGVRQAKIWVDKTTSQIIRSEIQGIPAEGYENVLEEAAQIGKDLIFTMTADYTVEKNGVLFPGQAEVIVEYPLNFWGYSKRTRVATEIRYDKYKFFTVNTESQILK